MNATETKKLLQSYLKKKLPPFVRGSADCCAWTAGWVNELIGEEVLKFDRITYGEAMRRLKSQPLAERVASFIEPLGFKALKKPKNGSVVIYECEVALNRQALGVMSDGAAVTRIEGEGLHITKEPKILKSWNLPLN